MQVGFTTLRGIAIQRPSLRLVALNMLLELTAHHGMYSLFDLRCRPILIHEIEKGTRGAAISTLKLHVQPTDSTIRELALQMLRKLQKLGPRPRPPKCKSMATRV
jgi:symplekin